MKKRILSLLLALFCGLIFVIPVFAEGEQTETANTQHFIFAEGASLSDEELSALEARASDLYATYGIKVYFLQPADGQQAKFCTQTFYFDNLYPCDCMIFTISGENYYGEAFGGAAQYFSADDFYSMAAAYAKGETDALRIEYFLRQTASLLRGRELRLTASGSDLISASKPRLVDFADCLSPDDEARLLLKLNEISSRQQFDVVVVTVPTLYGVDIQDFADDFYDRHGYGFGSDNDGALLLVSLEDGNRDVCISTAGYGITALTDYGIEYIFDSIIPSFSDERFFDGFCDFADCCDQFVTSARNGEPFDKDSGVLLPLAASLGGGALIGQIPLSSMKRKLKSVRRQVSASNYFNRERGLVMEQNTDSFLYSNVRRVRLNSGSGVSGRPGGSSGGGSTTHVSSSGTVHGGGHRRF